MSWDIDTLDKWVVLQGDCLERLKELPDESVDSIVTDPPAGVSFMGKKWDNPSTYGYSDGGNRVGGPPTVNLGRNPTCQTCGGRKRAGAATRGCECETPDFNDLELRTRDRTAFIDFMTKVMSECKRVLKPGGHALVWTLPRTAHWTTTGIEDAGFEIRDVIAHMFGCVPVETEILTEHGWRTPDQLNVGTRVVEVDSRGYAKLGVLDRINRYPYDGELCRINTRSTEQLLTPNHTIHAYEKHAKWRRMETASELTTITAGEIVGDDTPGVFSRLLPLSARGAETRRSLESRDVAELYGWVITEGHFHTDVRAVSIYQNTGPNADRIRALLTKLAIPFSEYTRTRTDYDGTPRETCQWYLRVGAWCERILTDLAGKKPTPPEWLAWLPDEEAHALFEALVSGDGSRAPGDESGAWYQKSDATRAWFQTLCFRLGYRTTENRDKFSVSWSRKDTTELQRKIHRERWASKVHYTGDVWCPTVRSGRWVARYRGNVFITGNSGFPKSMNVSKAITSGGGPEAIRRMEMGEDYTPSGRARANYDHGGASVMNGARRPAPTTAWDGWGTALKPAREDWVLARKPLIGTVAKNVLTHGTGGLNIDGCRIGDGADKGEWPITARRDPDALRGAEIAPAPVITDKTTGRWPANVVLSHAEGCEFVGTTADAVPQFTHPGNPSLNTFADGLNGSNRTGAMTEIVVDNYNCVEGCPILELDQQSGQSKSTKGKPRKSQAPGDGYGMTHTGAEYNDTGGASRYFKTFVYQAKPPRKEKDAGLSHLPKKTGGEAVDRQAGSAGVNNPRAGAGRTGGAHNFHPTVKGVTLMRYLCRLITPSGGIVLDPFAGSGSTGVAALQEGFRFIGCEKTEEYLPVIEGRLRHVCDEAVDNSSTDTIVSPEEPHDQLSEEDDFSSEHYEERDIGNL